MQHSFDPEKISIYKKECDGEPLKTEPVQPSSPGGVRL